MTTAERFWSHVNFGNGCWMWMGTIDERGYGRTMVKRKNYFAHRLAYQLATGVDPGDRFVCHHCDNPQCVRPDHLFLGNHSDNMKDSCCKGRMNPRHSHCKRGHALTEDNVYESIRPTGKRDRTCRKCNLAWHADKRSAQSMARP